MYFESGKKDLLPSTSRMASEHKLDNLQLFKQLAVIYDQVFKFVTLVQFIWMTKCSRNGTKQPDFLIQLINYQLRYLLIIEHSSPPKSAQLETHLRALRIQESGEF